MASLLIVHSELALSLVLRSNPYGVGGEYQHLRITDWGSSFFILPKTGVRLVPAVWVTECLV